MEMIVPASTGTPYAQVRVTSSGQDRLPRTDLLHLVEKNT